MFLFHATNNNNAIDVEIECCECEARSINFSSLDSTKFWMLKYEELKCKNYILHEQIDMLARQKEELEAKFARIKRFDGIIPICMHCKSIRNDDGVWQILEQYLTEHGDAAFSHGICPSCMEKHYPMIGNEDGF